MLIAAGAAAPSGSIRSAIMSNDLFATALGVASPWYVRNVAFDADKRLLTISIDFVRGSRFPYPGVEGQHPAHDTQTKRKPTVRDAGAVAMALPAGS